jgi:hypothetical protein
MLDASAVTSVVDVGAVDTVGFLTMAFLAAAGVDMTQSIQSRKQTNECEKNEPVVYTEMIFFRFCVFFHRLFFLSCFYKQNNTRKKSYTRLLR